MAGLGGGGGALAGLRGIIARGVAPARSIGGGGGGAKRTVGGG